MPKILSFLSKSPEKDPVAKHAFAEQLIEVAFGTRFNSNANDGVILERELDNKKRPSADWVLSTAEIMHEREYVDSDEAGRVLATNMLKFVCQWSIYSALDKPHSVAGIVAFYFMAASIDFAGEGTNRALRYQDWKENKTVTATANFVSAFCTQVFTEGAVWSLAPTLLSAALHLFICGYAMHVFDYDTLDWKVTDETDGPIHPEELFVIGSLAGVMFGAGWRKGHQKAAEFNKARMSLMHYLLE